MAPLISVTIEGLRGFASAQRLVLAQSNGKWGSGLTIVTGPNNAGKSTIVEALKHGASHQIEPSFNTGMRNSATDAVTLTYLFSNGEEDVIRSRRPGSSEVIIQRKSNVAPYVVPSRRHFSPYFGRSAMANRYEFSKYYGSHIDIRDQNLRGFEGRLFQIEKNNEDFDRMLREVVPDMMKWTIDQNETGQYFIKLTSAQKTHSLSGVGDGIVSLFTIITALFDSEEGDIIVIDEPELSLHPAVQKRLSRLIQHLASDRQIIVSTHSPYFVDSGAILNGGVVARTWDRASGIEIHHLSDQQSEAFTAFERLASPNVNNPHVFGLDAREMFFLDEGVVVFEGQEDVVLWPKVVTRKPELETVNVFGWGAGGAANIANVCRVLHSLGFRRVSGIVDGNRPADRSQLEQAFPEFRFFAIPANDIRTKPATSARPEVEGLLDRDYRVRPEFILPLDNMLDSLAEYFCYERPPAMV